jgi:hypothetical protein
MRLLGDYISLYHPAMRLATLALIKFQHDTHRQLTVDQDH